VTSDYDPRYLAGVVLFNQGDFFEAHEVWEDLWSEAAGDARKFYQGLIQAAVGLCHYCNGNLRGAAKLYRTSRAYMEPCGDHFLGLDLRKFWQQMERCFQPVLGVEDPPRGLEPDPELFPQIELTPAPESWPDPMAYVHEE
jgi:hypothetical protein